MDPLDRAMVDGMSNLVQRVAHDPVAPLYASGLQRFNQYIGYSFGHCGASSLLSMVVIGVRPNPASEHAVVGCGVEQHQREHEEAGAPEHERQARMRRGCVLDRDRERNHVRPKRESERAEGGGKDDGDNAKRRLVAAPLEARSQEDRGYDSDGGENEEIRSLEPSVHDRKMLDERKAEHRDQKQEQRE